jgi:hypothetical protein
MELLQSRRQRSPEKQRQLPHVGLGRAEKSWTPQLPDWTTRAGAGCTVRAQMATLAQSAALLATTGSNDGLGPVYCTITVVVADISMLTDRRSSTEFAT